MDFRCKYSRECFQYDLSRIRASQDEVFRYFTFTTFFGSRLLDEIILLQKICGQMIVCGNVYPNYSPVLEEKLFLGLA